ncbi:hypothetical protein L9F63_011307, partial [Diploptera punctata]
LDYSYIHLLCKLFIQILVLLNLLQERHHIVIKLGENPTPTYFPSQYSFAFMIEVTSLISEVVSASIFRTGIGRNKKSYMGNFQNLFYRRLSGLRYTINENERRKIYTSSP